MLGCWPWLMHGHMLLAAGLDTCVETCACLLALTHAWTHVLGRWPWLMHGHVRLAAFCGSYEECLGEWNMSEKARASVWRPAFWEDKCHGAFQASSKCTCRSHSVTVMKPCQWALLCTSGEKWACFVLSSMRPTWKPFVSWLYSSLSVERSLCPVFGTQYLYWNVFVYIYSIQCSCFLVCVYTSGCTHGGQSWCRVLVLITSSPLYFEAHFLTRPRAHWFYFPAGQQVQDSPASPFPAGRLQKCADTPRAYMASRDWVQGLTLTIWAVYQLSILPKAPPHFLF